MGERAETPDLRPHLKRDTSTVASWEGGGTAAGEVLPERIGSYRIIRVLGEGGMGRVYLAEQGQPVRRQVALKLILSGRLGREAVSRFAAERQALARMSHPAVAQVYDAGTSDDGQPFIAMEYVPGSRLSTYCDNHRLDLDQRLHLFTTVCRGVQHAHEKGIIHRDIKPSNILVSDHSDGPTVKIIDFGLAKALAEPLTEDTLLTGDRVVGTPSYLSPEAIEAPEGHDIDTRSDVYSLGVMLYELLVGVLPFEARGKSLAQLLNSRVTSDAPKPSDRLQSLDPAARSERAHERRISVGGLVRCLRRDLDWIVLRAMHKDREQRYASAAELADDIGRYRRNEPVLAGPPEIGYRLRKLVQRHRVWVGAALLVMLSVMVAVAGIVQQARRANREAEAARQVAGLLVELFEVSDPDLARGESITARELLDRAARRIDNELVTEPLTRATMMQTIGTVYRKLGLYEDACPLLEGAVALRRAHQADGAALAESLDNLGLLRAARGRFDEAEQLYREALELLQGVSGRDHPRLATVLTNLANLERERSHFDRAELIYQEALAIREAALGSDHPDLSPCLNGLGLVHFEQGRYEQAAELLQRAVHIAETSLGSDHPSLGVSLNNLALVRKYQGRYEQAEQLYLRDLQISEKALGKDHPAVAKTLNNLAVVYRHQGRLDEVEPLLKRSLLLRERSLGSDHPEVANCLNDLAALYWKQGRLEEAEELLRRVLQIREQALGEGHVGVAKVLSNLGALLVESQRYTDAEPLLLRSLAIFEKGLRPGHPHLAHPLHALANAYRELNRDGEAETLYRRALAIRRSALGEEHPGVREIEDDFEILRQRGTGGSGEPRSGR